MTRHGRAITRSCISFSRGGIDFGIVGCAVGASFAVLIAEEMFASGCKLLISVTSSGQIVPVRPPPYFILIERALRDEGTSYHYMAASDYSHADPALIAALDGAFDALQVPVLTGATWTTDAPFRETQPAIDAMREKNLMAVEMEAAALYAFAQVRQKPVLCFAHVTNQMGRIDGDFEKGEADGTKDALDLVAIAADRLRSRLRRERCRDRNHVQGAPAGPGKNATRESDRSGCRLGTVRLLFARRCRGD